MDFLNDIWIGFNEEWGTAMATLLALGALLKSTGKEIKQLVSAIWRWKAWAFVSRSYRKVMTLYRVRGAKNVMRRTLEENGVRVGIRVYDSCLRDDPRKSTRSQLNEITPAKPYWLNDYYVASALEALANEGSVAKATGYSLNHWPPKAESYIFQTVSANTTAHEEVVRMEINNKCVVYQYHQSCPRESRFEARGFAETVSASRTNFKTTLHLNETALPCDMCWEIEDRERDIRRLVESITKYDLAASTTPEVTGTNGEFQEAVATACIKSQCEAQVNVIKLVVEHAIGIRQRQIAKNTTELQNEWEQGVREELEAELREHIESQLVG